MSDTQPATAACAFGDPTCPCQDGDVCHYVDDPLSETLAMTPPATAARHLLGLGMAAGFFVGLITGVVIGHAL